jgi:accessory gene regulator protein AgrB
VLLASSHPANCQTTLWILSIALLAAAFFTVIVTVMSYVYVRPFRAGNSSNHTLSRVVAKAEKKELL